MASQVTDLEEYKARRIAEMDAARDITVVRSASGRRSSSSSRAKPLGKRRMASMDEPTRTERTRELRKALVHEAGCVFAARSAAAPNAAICTIANTRAAIEELYCGARNPVSVPRSMRARLGRWV